MRTVSLQVLDREGALQVDVDSSQALETLSLHPSTVRPDLPAIDTSLEAWLFLLGSLLLEFLVWG